jgi:hypothetical protein
LKRYSANANPSMDRQSCRIELPAPTELMARPASAWNPRPGGCELGSMPTFASVSNPDLRQSVPAFATIGATFFAMFSATRRRLVTTDASDSPATHASFADQPSAAPNTGLS